MDQGQPLLVFTAQRILAMDGTEPEALAVHGEQIVGSGSSAEMEARFPRAEWIDLEGAVVVPGFNDAHCHPSQAALARVRVDLTAVSGPDAVREALLERLLASRPGDWIVAQALDERRVGAGVVDRSFLDRVSRDHPIVVVHYSLHRAVANTRALERMGYREAGDAPPGGELLTDGSGALNGWLIERAWLDPWLPGLDREAVLPTGQIEAQVAALEEVNQELHALGITSYCDAIVTPVEQRMYASALAQGRLSPRVSMLLWHTYFDETSAFPPGERHRLQTAGVKMMLDGALSGGTCLCQTPYPSATGKDNGLQILSDDEFVATVRRVHAAGRRVAVHANGDRAIGKVLDAFASLPPSQDGHPVGHRIEHCSIVDDELIQRMRVLEVIPVPFGAFVHFHGEEILAYYGNEQQNSICAHRSLLDGGLAVAGSSDYPLVPADPLTAVQSMVTRRTEDGRVLGPEQRIPVEAALQVYTSGSAHATGEADVKGRLSPGQLADFVVLDRDITRIDPQDIGTTAVRSTWVGGRCVWRS
ncbi:amidohydrolase [Kocuria sp. NPDC057446]|uniref:amidohydrolase n=1 Tax=Kocuria sp. NPDC057446 TaxID=3346137 RepID=UPI0036B744C6